MIKISGEELLARYNAGERSFQNIILSNIRLSNDGVQLEEVNFSGAIFKDIFMYRASSINVSIGSIFINCNFSKSVWEFCEMPGFKGCNLQYALMRGCYFYIRFTDCDWRYGQVIGANFDEMIFERCNLSEGKWSNGRYIGFEDRGSGLGNFGIGYIETFDTDGVFHSGIYCNLPISGGDEIPF
jgi:uncharacterized protein YjbI with pentapeptide repeats